MPETDFAALQFLPWVREGAAAQVGDGGTLQVAVKLNGADIIMPMRLMGPAAVTGIDPRQIIRMEPRPGTVDFTPYYFPAIEFDRPDFPWLFTPARPDTNERVRPWLCLVVVEKQPGVSIRFPQGGLLAGLEIRRPARPGQRIARPERIVGVGSGTSGRTLGRIHSRRGPHHRRAESLPPRVPAPTKADTDYLACVVPTFEGGRRAGLGLPMESADPLAPSWPSGEAALPELTLPVYHSWEFRAGPPVDFESLVRLLQARPLPEQAGKQDVWIGQAGSGLPRLAPDAPGGTLAMQGALTPVDALPGDWPERPRAAYQSQLRAVVNAPTDALEQGATDPVGAPPIYGRWHAGKSRVDLNDGQPAWLHELNLDPRHRAAAGLGAEVIRRDQEPLMAAAWEQVGEVQKANQLLQQAQVARSVSRSLLVRHFRPLPEKTLLQVRAGARQTARGCAA